MPTDDLLMTIYRAMERHFGDLSWWPADSPFEVAVGAILTQNTNWKNVERAIAALKGRGFMTPTAIAKAEDVEIAACIRSSGYYNVKTKRLKAFVQFLEEGYGGEMETMCAGDMWPLREKLLGVNGIGEETADSILLYAGNMPIFVVDQYTKRILGRHDIVGERWKYGEIQQHCMRHLPHDAVLYNQYHALLVNTGKHFCRRRPLCDECPLCSIGSREDRT